MLKIATLALAAAIAGALPATAQRQMEARPVSDQIPDTSIRSDVAAILKKYDTSHDPDLLRDAADQIAREDGAPVPDPAQAKQAAHERLALWVDLFTRFKRDLDAGFDPNRPFETRVTPPEENGVQLMPGAPPSMIKDPALRKKYEDEIANNDARVKRYFLQSKLHDVHGTIMETAVSSLKNAREQLGLPPAEIKTALDKADIHAADRDALEAGALH
jgi:hypothetical protein